VSLWEAVLPEEVLRLPEELARVDALLDDSVFFAPFTPYFDPRLGRPSTPMEVYLRLMFLKFRYRLGLKPPVVRSPIRSRGGGSAGSRSTDGSRTRPH
jgi:IS5 family transposase